MTYQVVTHLTSKLNVEVAAIKTSYKNVLLNDLQRLLDTLNSAFNSTQKDHEKVITDLTQEEQHLNNVKGQIHTLR